MPYRRFGNILSISLSLLLGLFVILRLLPSEQAQGEQRVQKPTALSQQSVQLPSPAKAAMITYLLPPPPAPAAAPVSTPTQDPIDPAPVEKAPPLPGKIAQKPIKTPTPVPTTPAKVVKKSVEAKKPSATVASAAKPRATPARAVTPPAEKAKSERAATVAPQNIREGRAMLRILEHGVGPVIDIAWPKNPDKRAKLYDYFVSCLGMTTAVINQEGDLFRNADIRNQRWELNLDRSSGFLRQPSGRFSTAEAAVLKKIKQRHNRQKHADPVRIFPRKVDAYLLGGLQSIIGPGYKNNHAIRATYQLEGNRLLLTNIEADERQMSGRIDLSAVSRCRARV